MVRDIWPAGCAHRTLVALTQGAIVLAAGLTSRGLRAGLGTRR